MSMITHLKTFKSLFLPIVLFTICSISAFSQELRNYSGIVEDDEGLPLIGANILIRGTATGTISDLNGAFAIQAREGDTLAVLSIGYLDKEILLGSTLELHLVLKQDIVALEEVVVVGYGTMEKKEVTSAISHLSSKDLLKTGANNPLMSIQGRVSGLSVTNTGGNDPNSQPSIQLRGVTSRQAGSSPLIVIDGVPGGSLENVNQDDIESIDVLKDGAASAIYGTQGSNGVIAVTTKSGKGGKAAASYNGYVSFDIPNNELKPLSATEFRTTGRGTDYGASTDWLDAVQRDYSITQRQSISASGGSEYVNYYVSGDYRNAEGIDLRSTREEYGARLVVNHKSKNKLFEIGFTAAPRQYKRNNSDHDVFAHALNLNPTYPVRDTTNANLYYDIPSGSDGHYNPVELLNLDLNGSEAKFLDLIGRFKVNITRNLNSQVSLAQNSEDYFDFYFRPSTSKLLQRSGDYNGEASRNYFKKDRYNFDWISNYKLETDRHTLKAMAGYSYNYYVQSDLFAENKDFTSDATTYNNLGEGSYNREVEGRLGMNTSKMDSKLSAYFGRLSYSFSDKYLATASLRYEGSSKFGADNKWGFFPAFSVGWRISNEAFMQNADFISDLKLRADYGVTGNQAFASYQSLSTYQGFGQYYFENRYYTVWGPAENQNKDLRWELGKNSNLGLDFSLFKYRVDGSINFYNRKQEDLLGSYPYSNLRGPHEYIIANVGTMRNRGAELDLNIRLIDKAKLTYTAGLVASTNRTKFLYFSNDVFTGEDKVETVYMPGPGSPGSAQAIIEGESVGVFYMYKFAGIDQNGAMLVYNKNGDVIPGTEADPTQDKQIVGNGLPKYFLSINNTVNYKNFDLSLYLRGVFDYDIFNVHDFYYGLQSAPSNENVLRSAYSENSEIKGDKILCDYFLERGDYLKLDIITLGYTFDLKSRHVNSVRIYATGRNLFTLTGFSGVNPESYPINGLEPGIVASKAYYPSTAQFLFGLNVEF
jgi:TonB-dependent starch-binding outer membrane protein SusC